MAYYLGKSASEWLKVLEQAHPSQIETVLEAGKAFREEFTPAVPKLIEIARKHTAHRYEVGTCLHYIGTGCLANLCEELRKAQPNRPIDDMTVWVAQTLSRFKLYARSAGPPLRSVLESRKDFADPSDQQRAQQLVAALTEIDPASAVPVLTYLIQHRSFFTAIPLLGNCGGSARKSLSLLNRFSNDLSLEVGTSARVAIAKIEGNYLNESCPVCPSFDAKRLNALSLLELIGNQSFRLKRKCLRCGHVFT